MCDTVPNTKNLSLGSFYWLCLKLPDWEQLSPLKICAACSVTVLHSSLQTPQLQPTDTLKVGEELRNALAGKLPSITTNTISSLHPTERERERGRERVRKGGERGMNISLFADQTRREEEEGIICGTTLRAEPSATTLLLPDHNQMCQVCPNRNDCVKAIFSNLSDFRVAPPSSPHAP